MGTTTEYKFPYPADADAPDGPKQLKELAEALDKVQWLEKAIKDGAISSRKLKLTSGIIRSTADLELKEAFQSLAGTTLSITPLVKSKLIVVTFFQFQIAGAGSNAVGTVSVDEKDDEVHTSGPGYGGTSIQANFDGLGEVYEYELSAAEHVLALRAKGKKGEGFAESKANKGCSALWFLHAV